MHTSTHNRISEDPAPRVEFQPEGSPPDLVEDLLQQWASGDRRAENRLLTMLYPELRAVAAGCRRRRPYSATFQTTELIQELYLKLAGQRDRPKLSRSHFFAIAARAMRQILVDAARHKGRDKRGGGWIQLSFDEAATHNRSPGPDWLALDEAMGRLGRIDITALRVVELRYFAGLTGAETAEVLGVSRRTINRQWRFARAWLREQLESTEPPKATGS